MYFRGGLLLAIIGTMFSLPYLLASFGDPLGLGDAWRSPLGMTLGILAIVGGIAMVIAAFRLRRIEKRSEPRNRATPNP